jgi:predicted  nucleic acid-binding Zn-ribbon protein
MRRPVLYALVGAVIVLLATTVVYFQRYRQATADFTETRTEAEAARTSYGNAINAIAEIQDSLSAISVGDSSLRMRPGLATEGASAQGQDKEALEHIAVLKASVERAKARIQELEVSLKKTGIKVAGLQKMMNGLKESVAEKEQVIADLSTRVDALQTQVTGLTTAVEASRDTIATQTANLEEKRQELDTIYYVIGDKSSLTQQGIVEAKGGVLGMGKTMKPTGAYPSAHFTALDIDQNTVVRIPAKKAQVLTGQPTTSYLLRLVGEAWELKITDPQQFRSVKHLVIVTS